MRASRAIRATVALSSDICHVLDQSQLTGVSPETRRIPGKIGRTLTLVMCPGKTSDLAELRDQLAPGRRLLGLDVGAKTIGLAVSDRGLRLATPMHTVRRRKLKDDTAALRAIIADREIGGLVIGLPVNMDGSEGPRCQSVRQFAENIHPAIDLPIAFWDERLSTVAAEKTLIAQHVSRQRRGEVIDAHAAAFILQGALDRLQAMDDGTNP